MVGEVEKGPQQRAGHGLRASYEQVRHCPQQVVFCSSDVLIVCVHNNNNNNNNNNNIIIMSVFLERLST